MIIVFGQKVYGKKNTAMSWGHCESCGTFGKKIHYTGSKWTHIYYLPLIPSGGRTRVIHECLKCRNAFHIAQKKVPALLDELKTTSSNAIDALARGEEQFMDDGAMERCLPALYGTTEMFHALGEPNYIEWVLATLQEKNVMRAHDLVLGTVLEFRGELEDALDVYKTLAADCPDDLDVLRSLGSIYLLTGDNEKALAAILKTMDLSEDRDERLNLRQLLIGVYEEMGEYDNAIEQYDKCFELSPKLAKDKALRKAYKKACKKAQSASPYHS